MISSLKVFNFEGDFEILSIFQNINEKNIKLYANFDFDKIDLIFLM